VAAVCPLAACMIRGFLFECVLISMIQRRPCPRTPGLISTFFIFFGNCFYDGVSRSKKKKTGVSTKQRVQKVLRNIEIALSSPKNYLGIITQHY
jgi:hypothetical protein